MFKAFPHHHHSSILQRFPCVCCDSVPPTEKIISPLAFNYSWNYLKTKIDPPLINIYTQWRYSRVTSSTINKSFQLHFTSLITMVCFINHSKHSFIAFIHLLTRLLMYSCCEWCLSVFLWTRSHISLAGDECIQVIIIAKWELTQFAVHYPEVKKIIRE